MTTNQPGRIDEELLEMAEAQRRLGIMDDATYRKITIRHLGPALALLNVIPRKGIEALQ